MTTLYLFISYTPRTYGHRTTTLKLKKFIGLLVRDNNEKGLMKTFNNYSIFPHQTGDNSSPGSA